MKNKELNKVQNEVKKASEKTLTGAVKAWCQLFKSGKEILPRVDETFCAYKEIERVYFDKQEQDKNTKLSEDKVAEISITGKAHKRFGYNEPIEYEGGVYYELFNGV